MKGASGKIFQGGYLQLRYLKEKKGRIYVLYITIMQEKEMTKHELFCRVLNLTRGKKVCGSLPDAYRTLKFLKVIEDNHLKMDRCKVRFVKEYSIKEIDKFMTLNTKSKTV